MEGDAMEQQAAVTQDTPNVTPTETPVAPVQTEQVAEIQAQAPEPQPTVVELKLPDGAFLGSDAIDEVKSFAKDNNLPLDMAQKILERQDGSIKWFHDQLQEKANQTRTEWAEAAKVDPEFGGDKFGESVTLAKRVLEKFATPMFLSEIDKTGYGNHPEVVRIFSRIGKMLLEDKVVSPSAHTPAKKSYEEIFYNN